MSHSLKRILFLALSVTERVSQCVCTFIRTHKSHPLWPICQWGRGTVSNWVICLFPQLSLRARSRSGSRAQTSCCFFPQGSYSHRLNAFIQMQLKSSCTIATWCVDLAGSQQEPVRNQSVREVIERSFFFFFLLQ